MPLIANLLITLFSGVAGFFATFVTKKIALATAAIAAFAVLTGVLYAAMAVAISGLISAFPESGTMIGTMLWVALPDAVPIMVSSCIAADTAIALYRWNIENVKLAAFAS